MLLAVLLIGNTSSFPISSYSSPALATIEKFVKIVDFPTEIETCFLLNIQERIIKISTRVI